MKTFEILRILLLLMSLVALPAGNLLAADVTVYGEGTYTSEQVTVSLYADISPTKPILSWGVALHYSPGELTVVSAEKNAAVWYLGQSPNNFSYMSPDTKTPGVITFIGAKLDAAKPTAGIIGSRVLLGTAKFIRNTSAQPPLKGEKEFFGLSLGPARTSPYKSFVTTGGVILDPQIDFTTKGFVVLQAGDAKIVSKASPNKADDVREGPPADGGFILFAHGMDDGPNSWQSFAKHAGEHGYKSFRTQVDGCGSIETRAWQLARFINTLNLPPRSLKAVGHSMGGLDLRMIVGKASEGLEPYLSAARTLKKVYTLATPHNGISPASSWLPHCQPATGDLGEKAMEDFNTKYPYSKFKVDGEQMPFMAFRFVCRPCGVGVSLGETDGMVGFHGQEWFGAPPFSPVLQGQHANAVPLCSPNTCVLETENIAVLDQILDDPATDPAWAQTVGKQEKKWSGETGIDEHFGLQFGADHRWERCQAIVNGHVGKDTFGELTVAAGPVASKDFGFDWWESSETVLLEINKAVPVTVSGTIDSRAHDVTPKILGRGGATLEATCYFDGASGPGKVKKTWADSTDIGSSKPFSLEFGKEQEWRKCEAKITNKKEFHTNGNIKISTPLTAKNISFSPLYNEDGDLLSLDVWGKDPVQFTGWIGNKHVIRGAGATVDATCFYTKADFNSDGKIDMPDIEKLAATFGRSDCKTGPSCDADFNGDGVVDGMDAAGFALAMRRNLSKNKLRESGEGGLISLVNGTRYDWKKTYQQQDHMYHWSFPDTIPAGSSSTVYVQWGSNKVPADEVGKATYSLGETGLNFQVKASARKEFALGVELSNFATPGNPQGSTINLKWNKGGYVNFILSGEEGAFISSNLPTSWMQDNLNMLGDRTLRQLCMPGSHDSGMSIFASGTSGANEGNTLTQTNNIYGQLQAGARYFDIRPVISAGKYLTGHYGCPKEEFCLGANGQSIDSIINDINTFTTSNKELVILKLSHDLNTDRGVGSYVPFTQTEWDGLFSMLKKGIKKLIIAEGSNDLTRIKLKDFIGGGRAAVIVVVDPDRGGINLGDYTNQGFFLKENFPVYDEYSNTNDLGQMTNDQLGKMRTPKSTPYFLLSWTLTQKFPEVITGNPSILDLANKANPLLYGLLLPACSDQVYPNILYIDNIQSSDIAALAMAVNSKAIFGERAAKKPLAGNLK